MKRLLLALTLVLAASAAYAQVGDRDVLLTSDGTLYTIDVQSKDSAGSATNYLSLTVQQGKSVTRTAVPETIDNGLNWLPALAFDSDSKTLFVFWLSRPATSLSRYLFVASLHDGKWQPAVAIDNHPSDLSLRSNLRIGITRQLAQVQQDTSTSDVPALLLHCVWWEDAGRGEEARYALLTVDKGIATVADIHSLSEFVTPSAPVEVAANFNADILRHPAVLDGPTPDAIDVVFGDTTTNSFHHTTLRPIADGRIHIPIPYHGDRPFPGPATFSFDWSGRVTTIAGHDNRIVMASTTSDAVSYIMYAKGAWTTLRSINTDDRLTSDGALAALTRMAAGQ
jgi:hypothetical protein